MVRGWQDAVLWRKGRNASSGSVEERRNRSGVTNPGQRTCTTSQETGGAATGLALVKLETLYGVLSKDKKSPGHNSIKSIGIGQGGRGEDDGDRWRERRL
ncbi:hypothetical protein LX36DRAFT_182287 [Colletotrichum falcatum]|nr:hypothetical protein LX36DRAFT_182287 [Colletotrichum falcatum]